MTSSNSTSQPVSAPLLLSGTPTITTQKLNWKNYLSWSASVELWFLGQGRYDHLEKEADDIPAENRDQWMTLDFQLCAVLWQSVEPDLLETLRSFKTCCSFWKNAQDIFANDIQNLFDSANRAFSLKQTSHDMTSHIAKAKAAVEELRKFLIHESADEMKRRIDKLFMVIILRSLHSDFSHVRDQIMASEHVPSMNSLVT